MESDVVIQDWTPNEKGAIGALCPGQRGQEDHGFLMLQMFGQHRTCVGRVSRTSTTTCKWKVMGAKRLRLRQTTLRAGGAGSGSRATHATLRGRAG